MYLEKFMTIAMEFAETAFKENEVPVGAIVVKSGTIIGSGFNQVISTNSVSSHAEIIAINNASQTINNYRLKECDIYVTLEPCHMCAKAIVDARIKNLYFAAPEPKTGAIISVDNFLEKKFLNHRVHYEHGILCEESAELLRSFFASKRN
jgi:tRNA(adenine34) deaminase